MKKMILVLGLSVFGFAGFACTSNKPKVQPVVNLATWSNYISPELIKNFTARTGIQVQVSNYSSNEELLAKLQAGATGFDVIVPSDYMIFAMAKLGLLKELDPRQLSNLKSIDERYLKKPFDPTNKYSVPYDWGTTGIAINKSLYSGSIKGWKDLFGKPELAGKFSLLDDMRETIGAALKSLGYSLNSTNPKELAQAKALLLQARKRVKSFTSEPLMPLVNGEMPVAHAYSSDALQAQKKSGGKVVYFVPEEGGTFWIDNLAIPVTSQHLAEAHSFINFLLEPQSNLATVMSILVSPANRETVALLPPDLRKDPELFPSAESLAKCEMIQDLGESLAAWDRVWTEVKASN